MKKKKIEIFISFLIVFNLLSIPMYIALYFNFSYLPLRTFLAEVTSTALNSLGYKNTVYLSTLNVDSKFGQQAIDVSMDSTGWKSLYALVALTLAVPFSTAKNKIRFLAIALPAIFIINFFRILTTIVVAINYGFQYFDVVHNLLWREGLIFVVLIIWFLWLRKINYNIRQKQLIFRWNFGKDH